MPTKRLEHISVLGKCRYYFPVVHVVTQPVIKTGLMRKAMLTLMGIEELSAAVVDAETMEQT